MNLSKRLRAMKAGYVSEADAKSLLSKDWVVVKDYPYDFPKGAWQVLNNHNGDHGPWETDYKAAKAQAQELNDKRAIKYSDL